MRIKNNKKKLLNIKEDFLNKERKSFSSSKFSNNSSIKEKEEIIFNDTLTFIKANEYFNMNNNITIPIKKSQTNDLIPKIMNTISFLNNLNNKTNISHIESFSTININKNDDFGFNDNNNCNKNINYIMYSIINKFKKKNNNYKNIDNIDNNIENENEENYFYLYELNLNKYKNNNKEKINLSKTNPYQIKSNYIYNKKRSIINKIENSSKEKNENINKQNIENDLKEKIYINNNINNRNNNLKNNDEKKFNNRTISPIVYKNKKWINKRMQNVDDFSINHNTSFDDKKNDSKRIKNPNDNIYYNNNNNFQIYSNNSFIISQKPLNKSCEKKK